MTVRTDLSLSSVHRLITASAELPGQPVDEHLRPTTATNPSYAQITSAFRPQRALTARRIAATVRPSHESTGRQGFEYVWIPRNCRMTMSEVGKAPIVRSQIAAELHDMGWMAEESLPTRMAYIDRDDPAGAFSSDAPAPGSPSPSPVATMTPVPAMVPTAVPMTAPASPAPSRQATPSRRATPSRTSTPSTPSTPTHRYNTRAKRNADAMKVAHELSSSSDEEMAEDTHPDTHQ
ncbi:unnamed protein product [Umbelopsis vinacea]